MGIRLMNLKGTLRKSVAYFQEAWRYKILKQEKRQKNISVSFGWNNFRMNHWIQYLSLQDQCNNLVDTYGPLIIQELIQEVEATEICKKLGLCPQNEDLGDSLTSFRDEISVQSLNPFEMQKKEDSTCATCSYVTSMILDQVNWKYVRVVTSKDRLIKWW